MYCKYLVLRALLSVQDQRLLSPLMCLLPKLPIHQVLISIFYGARHVVDTYPLVLGTERRTFVDREAT